MHLYTHCTLLAFFFFFPKNPLLWSQVKIIHIVGMSVMFTGSEFDPYASVTLTDVNST